MFAIDEFIMSCESMYICEHDYSIGCEGILNTIGVKIRQLVAWIRQKLTELFRFISKRKNVMITKQQAEFLDKSYRASNDEYYLFNKWYEIKRNYLTGEIEGDRKFTYPISKIKKMINDIKAFTTDKRDDEELDTIREATVSLQQILYQKSTKESNEYKREDVEDTPPIIKENDLRYSNIKKKNARVYVQEFHIFKSDSMYEDLCGALDILFDSNADINLNKNALDTLLSFTKIDTRKPFTISTFNVNETNDHIEVYLVAQYAEPITLKPGTRLIHGSNIDNLTSLRPSHMQHQKLRVGVKPSRIYSSPRVYFTVKTSVHDVGGVSFDVGNGANYEYIVTGKEKIYIDPEYLEAHSVFIETNNELRVNKIIEE